jgi:hypothetical protein
MAITSLDCAGSISGTSLVAKVNELIAEANSTETQVNTLDTDLTTLEATVASLLNPAWIAVAQSDLGTGWLLPTELPSPDNTSENLKYRKLGDMVQFKGDIYGSVGNAAVAFVLPVGYRPSKERLVTVFGGQPEKNQAFVYALVNGEIRIDRTVITGQTNSTPSPNQLFYSLNGVSYAV